MFNRWIEPGLLAALREQGIGCIVFSPLAQGLLTDRYLSGIPADSRAAKPHGFLKREEVTEDVLAKVRRLNECARARGQTLAQMALAWVLRHPEVTSALIGASRPGHIDDAVAALGNRSFDAAELRSEEHTSELQSPCNLVCRLLLEKKKNKYTAVMAMILAARQRSPKLFTLRSSSTCPSQGVRSGQRVPHRVPDRRTFTVRSAGYSR